MSQLVLVAGASLLLQAGTLQVLGMKIPLKFSLLSSYSKNCWSLKIALFICGVLFPLSIM